MKLFDQISEPSVFRRDLSPLPFLEAKANFERQYLDELLRFARGNVKLAAEIAGRDRKGLYILMEKHDIRPSHYRLGHSV
ncbi:hypothetical protein JXA80_05645 [bacterium]|nr:hypothetical protein [candidate division CSSED10-310 bacterium]